MTTPRFSYYQVYLDIVFCAQVKEFKVSLQIVIDSNAFVENKLLKVECGHFVVVELPKYATLAD